jgi:hypothetical protein
MTSLHSYKMFQFEASAGVRLLGLEVASYIVRERLLFKELATFCYAYVCDDMLIV